VAYSTGGIVSNGGLLYSSSVGRCFLKRTLDLYRDSELVHRLAIDFRHWSRSSGAPGMSFLALLIARFSGAFKLARTPGGSVPNACSITDPKVVSDFGEIDGD
jgi:hypothetical protein